MSKWDRTHPPDYVPAAQANNVQYDDAGYWIVKKTTDLRGNPRIREELLVTVFNANPSGITRRGGPTLQTINGIIFDGDSLTDVGLDGAYPPLVAGLSGQAVYNSGFSGTKLSTMVTNYATDISPLKGTYNTILVMAGTNDINFDDATLAQMQSRMQSYVTNAKTDGFRVYVGTIPARTNASYTATSTTAASKQAVLTNFNSWIRNNYNVAQSSNGVGADGLVDFAQDSRLSNPADTVYYNADGLHQVNAGRLALAEVATTAMGIAVPAVTWDANNKDASVTLSPDKLVATGTVATGAYAVVCGHKPVGAGVHTFSVIATSLNPSIMVGITGLNHGKTITLGGGGQKGGGYWTATGQWKPNNTASGLTAVQGDTINVEWTGSTRILRVNVNGGAWSSYDLSALFATNEPVFPTVDLNGASVVTANFSGW